MEELLAKIEQTDLNDEKKLDELLEEIRNNSENDNENFVKVDLFKQKKFQIDNNIAYEPYTFYSIIEEQSKTIERMNDESASRIVDLYCTLLENEDFENAKICKRLIDAGNNRTIREKLNSESERVSVLEKKLDKYNKQQIILSKKRELSERVKKSEKDSKPQAIEKENHDEEVIKKHERIDSAEEINEEQQVNEKKALEGKVYWLFGLTNSLGMHDYAYNMLELKKNITPQDLEEVKNILHNRDIINKITKKEIPKDTVKYVESLMSKDENQLKDLSDESYRQGLEILREKIEKEERAKELEEKKKVAQQEKKNVKKKVANLFNEGDSIESSNFADKMRNIKENMTPSELEYLNQVLNDKNLIKKITNREISEETVKYVQILSSKNEDELRKLSNEWNKRDLENLLKQFDMTFNNNSKSEESQKVNIKQEEDFIEPHLNIGQKQETKMIKEEQTEIQADQESIVIEEPQNEQIILQEESIKDEIGEDIKDNPQQMIERKNPTVNLWMNRFNGWYNAIDRVSQNVKTKFVKMKSDIIKTIRNKLKEKEIINTKDTSEKGR